MPLIPVDAFESKSGVGAKLPPFLWFFGPDIGRIEGILQQRVAAWKAEDAAQQRIHVRHFHLKEEASWNELEQSLGQLDLFEERSYQVIHLLSWSEGRAIRLYEQLKGVPSSHGILVGSPLVSKKFWGKIREHHESWGWVQVPQLDADSFCRWVGQEALKWELQLSVADLKKLARACGNSTQAARMVLQHLKVLPDSLDDLLPSQLEGQFDVFQLQTVMMQSITRQNAAFVLPLLKALWAQGTSPVLVLWALTEDLKGALEHLETGGAAVIPGGRRAQVWARAFSKTQISHFFKQASFIDSQLKSQDIEWGILVLEHWIQEILKACVASGS